MLLLAALALLQAPCPAPDTATLFAPRLADSARVYRGTFSADGRTLYYFRKLRLERGAEDYRIMVARRQGSEWQAGEPLDLGGDYSDLYPSVSPDGKRLVFASYRPAPGDTASHPNAYLWYAERQGTGWGPPVFIGAAAQFGSYHSGPLIGKDYAIRFARTSPDWTSTEVLVTRWDGTRYLPAVWAEGDDLRASWKGWRPATHHVWGGALLDGGKAAVLDVSPLNDKGRRGPAQVWVTRRRDAGWTEPVLAGGGVNGAGWVNFIAPLPGNCGVLFVRDFSRFERVSLETLLAPSREAPLRAP